MKWRGIAVSLFLCASTAFAQSGPGTITGTLTDPDGGVVGAGAAVEAKNTVTGAITSATSLDTGDFTLSPLPAGTYDLTVPKLGVRFLRYVQPGIVVQAGQVFRADIRLEWVNLGVLGDDNAYLVLRKKYAGVTGPAPRTPEGKPDFSGVWHSSGIGNPEPAATLPWVADVMKERKENALRDLPSAYCLPYEVFPGFPFLYRVVQTASVLVHLHEHAPNYRLVFLDDRAHPSDPDPTWMGHSIGKWEGDTLVIDTIGFNDKTWLPENLPHTERLHVIERYRRPDLGHLNIDVTLEDPGTFTKPWQLHMAWQLAPGEEILEYICAENNKYQENTGGK